MGTLTRTNYIYYVLKAWIPNIILNLITMLHQRLLIVLTFEYELSFEDLMFMLEIIDGA